MMAITIFFAMLGMLSPASRGALLTASIFLWVATLKTGNCSIQITWRIYCERYEFMGLVAGYYSGRLYKTMKGKEWKVRICIIFERFSQASNLSISSIQGCRFPHGNPLPWDCLWHWLLCEPVHLGEALQWSNPLHHHACCCCHVVWYLLASCLPRILLRIQVALSWLLTDYILPFMQEAAVWASCKDQPDPTPGAHPGKVQFNQCTSLVKSYEYIFFVEVWTCHLPYAPYFEKYQYNYCGKRFSQK